MKDSFLGKLTSFFNEHAIDENPILLYILILALQTKNDQEFRKSLLSDISDTYICMMRSESEHLKIKFDDKSFDNYKIDKNDPVEDMFYSNFYQKLDKFVHESPEENKKEL